MPKPPQQDSSESRRSFASVLRALPHNWIRWTSKLNPAGKPSKAPDQSTKLKGRSYASVTKGPSNATEGPGLMLTGPVRLPTGEQLIVLDQDACVHSPKRVEFWAQEILDAYRGTFVEGSPSGLGLHTYLWVKNPPKLLSIRSKIRIPGAPSMQTPFGTKHAELQIFGLGPACYVTVTERAFTASDKILVVDNLDWLIERFNLAANNEETIESLAELLKTPGTVGGAGRIFARLIQQDLEGLIEGQWQAHVGEDGTASSAYWQLVQHALRSANGNVTDTIEFLLQCTAWGRGDVEESADPSRYARAEWVSAEVGRAAQKMPSVVTDPSSVFEPLPPLQGSIGVSDKKPLSELFAQLCVPLDDETMEQPPPPREYLLLRPSSLIDGKLIPGGGFASMGIVGFLSSAGGVGKTNLLMQLAVSVIVGKPWLGFEVNKKRAGGRVLLVLAEETRAEVKRRLWLISQHLQLTKTERALVRKQLLVLPLSGRTCALATVNKDTGLMEPTDLYRGMQDYLGASKEPWALVVLDPLARLFPKAESANEIGTNAVQLAEALCKAPGNPLLVLAHHSSKMSRRGGDVDSRGVTALPDASRLELLLQETRGGIIELRQGKTSYAAPMDPLKLRRVDGSGLLRLATAEDRKAQEDATASEEVAQVQADLSRVLAALVKFGPTKSVKLIAKRAGLRKTDAMVAIELGMEQGSVVREGEALKDRVYRAAEGPSGTKGTNEGGIDDLLA